MRRARQDGDNLQTRSCGMAKYIVCVGLPVHIDATELFSVAAAARSYSAVCSLLPVCVRVCYYH